MNDQLLSPEITRQDLGDAVRATAMLADLAVSVWTGERTDKKVSAKVKEDHSAVGDTGRYVKKLMAGADERLKEVKSAYAVARIKHHELTLPWLGGQGGARLLPNLLFDRYCEEMVRHREGCKELRNRFIAEYPALIERAKGNLGSMANDLDYPPADEIKRSFSIDFHFSPIPEAGAFQGLPDHAIESLARALRKRHEEAVQAAQAGMWERVRTAVDHLVERLGNPENSFKGATIESVRELITLLPGFNCAGDTRVGPVVEAIRAMLGGVQPEDIRKDASLRNQVAGEARNILDRMQQWGI